MLLGKIVEDLNLEVVAGYKDKKKEVEGAYIGDLLSIVMARAKENNVWITIQTHLNIIAVATLVGISCIIVTEGMEIEEDTIKKANEINIPLFRTKLTSYEVACRLNELGV